MTAKASIIEGLPFAEYAKLDGINASALKAGHLSPLHVESYSNEPDDPTDAMTLGGAIHDAVLCGGAGNYVAWPSRRAGAEYEKFCDEQAKLGKVVLSKSEHDNMLGAMNRVTAHPFARYLLSLPSRRELSITWETKKYGRAKARIDALAQEPDGKCVVIEYKTSADISERNFERTCFKLFYHWQLGWYKEGCMKAKIKPAAMYVIAQEQKSPWDVRVLRVTQMLIDEGRKQAVKLASKWWSEKNAGCLSGQSSDVEMLRLPAWAVSGETDLSNGTMKGSEL